MQHHLLLIILSLSCIITANSGCIDTAAAISNVCPGTPTAPLTISSFPNLPSGGTKKLSLAFMGRVTSYCGQTGDIPYLTMTLSKSGTETRFLTFAFHYFNQWSIQLTSFSTPVAMTELYWTATPPPILNKWVEFGAAIDITAGEATASYAYTFLNYLGLSGGISSSWVFDNSIKFYIGADINNLTPVSCDIKDLRILYDSIPNHGNQFPMIPSGTSPALIAYYPLNERDGVVFNNTAGTLGPAYMGLSTSSTVDPDNTHMPVWPPGAPGIEFTASTQYITAPGFASVAPNEAVPFSISVNFWLKLDSSSATGSFIFRHTNLAGTVNNFACIVVGPSRIGLIVNGIQTGMIVNDAVNSELSVTNAWTFVYYNVLMSELTGSQDILITFEHSPFVVYDMAFSLVSAFANPSMFRIGGPPSFIGHIAHFKIMNPSSPIIFPSPPSCNFGTDSFFGLTTTPIAFRQTCHATCADCFSSAANGCITCTGSLLLYNSECIFPCPPVTYTLSSLYCVDCPLGCATCTSATSCQSCIYGYFLPGSLCQPCHSSCGTCTNGLATGCLSCRAGFKFESSACVPCAPGTCPGEESLWTTIKNTLGTVAKVSLFSASFAFGGNAQSIFVGIMSQFIQYLKYLDITYSEELTFMLLNWDTSLFSIDFDIGLPEDIENDELLYYPLPEVFREYGLHPSFLNNFWNDLILIAIVMAALVCFLILEKVASSPKKTPLYSFMKGLRVRFQNFLIMLLYNGYGSIVFFSMNELRTMEWSLNIAILSLIMSVLFFIVGPVLFYIHVQLLLKYQKLKTKPNGKISTEQKEKFTEQNKGFQVLFEEFKDESLSQQAFLLAFTFRDILFNLALATLFEHGLAAVIIIIVLNLMSLLYLVMKRPLEILDLIQLVLLELLLLVVNGSVLVMATLDDNDSSEKRDVASDIIVWISTILNAIPIGFLLISLCIKLRDYLKNRNVKKSENRQLQEIPQATNNTRTTHNTLPSKPSPRRNKKKLFHENGLVITKARQQPSIQEYAEQSVNISLNNDSSFLSETNPPLRLRGQDLDRSDNLTIRPINNRSQSSASIELIEAYRQSRHAIMRMKAQRPTTLRAISNHLNQ